MGAPTKTNKLLWIDLEMSGLDVEKEVIIEAAAVITDIKLEPIGDTYHSVVKQPQKYIDGMDEWNQTQHTKTGLIEQIPNGKEPEFVDQELADFIEKQFQGEPAILAGNSIGQDRKFIDRYFAKTSEKLHYRMLDVTSWKIIMEPTFNVVHEKKDTHRALDDILESIAELKTYTSFISQNKN